MTLLLGIDIGTSSVKAALFDPDQQTVVGVAADEYPIHKPAVDRAEQNAEDWWAASVRAVRGALAAAGRNDVAAIGLSGQMHGGVLLDAAGEPVHPAIIWADQRSSAESDWLVEVVGGEAYAALAGTLPAVGFMGPTLVWLQRHQPDVLERARVVLMPKDYVRYRLTGERATDITDAAATGLLDVVQGAWAAALLSRTGLPADILPPILGSADVAGTLQREAAEALGLPAGIPVAAGCADQPAQAIGNGLITPGKASVTTGSGGQVFTPVYLRQGRLATDPRLHVFNHAVPQTWYVLGAILAAGLNLRWLRGLTGLDAAPDAYARFSAEAADLPPGADGLLYLPYLYGERTPHMDSFARGALVGLSFHHGRGHLARAMMEGVSFALRQSLELSLALGGEVDLIIAAGGGASSPVWRQIQADIYGLPLQQALLPEQASLGAALLGGVGAGLWADIPEASASVVAYGPTTDPDPARHAHYNELYAQFTGLYPKLKDDFHRLAGDPHRP